MGTYAFGYWLGRLLRWRATPAATFLLPAAEMYRTFQRERLRTDRSGEIFSVVIFTAVRAQFRHSTTAELSRILAQRLRGSDAAGYLFDGRICVLLPITPAEGARLVADDVHARWAAQVPAPPYQIYAYPKDGHTWPRLAAEQAAASAGEQPVRGAETLLLPPTPLWKRLLDLAGASLGLILLAPLLLLIACIIRLTSPGPVLFKQVRSGRGGHPFQMYKFRSMVIDAESRQQDLRERNERDGPAFKIEDDPRVTRVGHFLRVTNLDELPQLWNVLKGEMSLVGPRPLPWQESDDCEVWQRRRLDVTPGMTCIWQATSHRSKIPFAEWVRMDLRYIRSRSLSTDLKLVCQTIRSIFFRKAC